MLARRDPSVRAGLAYSLEMTLYSNPELFVNSYTHPLNFEQAEKLRALLGERGFTFAPKPHTIFFAQKEKLSVAVYEKGPKI